MKGFFPFTHFAVELGHAHSPALAMSLWMRDREAVAPETTWYALDLEVLAADVVKVHVRSIEDGLYGGIGAVVFSYVPQLRPADLAELRELILTRQLKLAEAEFERREKRRVELVVEGIRREMFGDLT